MIVMIVTLISNLDVKILNLRLTSAPAMGKYCICGQPLQHDEVNQVIMNGSACRSCYREILPNHDEAVYTCWSQENCLYSTIAKQTYYICGTCYEDDFKQSGDIKNKMKWISSSFNHSLSIIS